MLKVILFMVFMIPSGFIKNAFWMIRNVLFFIIFYFIIYSYYDIYFMNLSYFLACDLISYFLI